MDTPTWWEKFRCRFQGHLNGDPVTTQEDSCMSIPGEDKQRHVVLRITTVSCTRCGSLRGLWPAGVVRDDGPGSWSATTVVE